MCPFKKPLTVSALFTTLVSTVFSQCNPLQGPCDALAGLNVTEYFVDFTQQNATPARWIQANYETVNYGKDGAEFTLARKGDAPYIWTDFYFLFGRVEVVMQAAPGTGVISSAVLLSDDLDEIDWEFSGNNFGLSGGRLQTNYFGKGITGNYDRGTQPQVSDPTKAFHTYSLEWSATKVVWSVDGNIIRTLPYSSTNLGPYQYPQSPMRLHLGLWDGGDPDASQGVVGWAGGYTDLTQLPYTAYVKSVKIVTGQPCSSYIYGDRTGSYKSIQCLNNTLLNTTSLTPTQPVTTSFQVAPSVTSATSLFPTNPLLYTSVYGGESSSSIFVSSASFPNISMLTASSPKATLGNSTLYTSTISGFTSSTLSDISSLPSIAPSDLNAPNTIHITRISFGLDSKAANTSSSSASESLWASISMPAITPTSAEALSVASSNIRSISRLIPMPSRTLTPSTSLRCNQDNCFRSLLVPRYYSTNKKFCSSWLATATSPADIPQIPPYLIRGCQNNFEKVSSACNCLPTQLPSSLRTFPKEARIQ